MSKLEPIADRVVVEPVDRSSTSPGGILLPESVENGHREGIVRAVGPGHFSDSGHLLTSTLKPGQHVIFAKYAGAEITLNGHKVFVIKESDIFAIVHED